MAVIVPILSTFNAAGIKAATGALGALGNSLKRVGLQAAAAAGGIKALGAAVNFVSESITAARDLDRNLFALNTVFGSLNPQMVEFTKNAANMGISQVDAARTATFLGSVLKQAGFEMGDVATETVKLTTLAQDLATTYGYDVSEALTAMTALFRGEYDPIEKFGVALKQNEVNSLLAAKGMGNLTGQALLNAQQQIRLEQLYKRSADAQGAFAAQAGTLYGSQARLNATFENLKATLGERLLPVINDFTNALIPLVQDLAPEGDKAFKGLADVMESLEPLLKPLVSIFGSLTGGVGTLFSALAPLISFFADVVAVVLEFIADMLIHVSDGVEDAVKLFNDLGAIVNNQFGNGVMTWIKDFINGSNILRPLIGWLVDRLSLIGTDTNRAAKAESDRLTAQALAWKKSQTITQSTTIVSDSAEKSKKAADDAAKKAADAFQASLKVTKDAAEKARKAYQDLRDAIDEFNKGFAITLDGFKEMFAFSTPLGEFEQKAVDAFKNITDAAKEAFDKGLISPKVLAELQAYADREKTILVGIAKQRDVLQKKISIAQSISSGVLGGLNITAMLETETRQVTKSVTSMVDGIRLTTTRTFDEVVTGGLTTSFKKLIDKTKAFAANLVALKKLGLNGSLFKQIVDAGVEAGGATAEAIVAGGPATIAELNGLFTELTDAGSDIASTATDVMYGLGEDVTNSFIEGLRAQDNALIAAAQAMANTFANSFNVQLGSAMDMNLTASAVTAGVNMDSTDYIRGYGRVNASGINPAGQSVVNVTVQANTITDQASLPQIIVDALGTYRKQAGSGGLTRVFRLSMPLDEKIELGFDLPSSVGPFFTLDDPVKGVLDNTTYVLSGVIFFDVTSRVKRYAIRRGKSRQLENFNTGIASVLFDNRDRAFDPTFAASPYFGQVIPKREIRITTNGQRRYTGLIDDWNLDYSLGGDSTASVSASDGFAKLANQTFTGGTATAQLSGARISAVLDSSDVLWPTDARAIDVGTKQLGADVFDVDGNVLDYLQRVEASELGHFFIDKLGRVTFKDANTLLPDGASAVTLSDDGTGIPYSGMQVVYGSELLYNQIVVSSVNAAGTAIADDLDSQNLYGIQTYTRTDLLLDNDADVDDHALTLAREYAYPEYRFENITVNLDTLEPAQVESILNLEIGSLCIVSFTPNGISPAISKYAEVIAIADSTDTVRHSVTLGFSTLDYVPLILDDVAFGRLDEGTLG